MPAPFSQNLTVAGLETMNVYVTTAGPYTISGKLALPSARDTGVASQVVTTVKQNGTTILTTTAGATGFALPVLAAAGDEFTVILSSSTAEDEVLEAVRCDVSIG